MGSRRLDRSTVALALVWSGLGFYAYGCGGGGGHSSGFGSPPPGNPGGPVPPLPPFCAPTPPPPPPPPPPPAAPPSGLYPWPVWTGTIPAVSPSTTGKTYYVDTKAGKDTNNGTAVATAFKTVAKALT